jgi:hypothetical protein
VSNQSTQDRQQLLESRWKSLRSAIRSRWQEITDEDIRMIGGDSRKLIALINQKTDMPLSEIEQAIDEIAAGSGGLLTRVIRSTENAAKKAGEQVARPLGQVYHQAQRQVTRHPGISLSGAFCAGMLIGVCLAALNRE